MTTIEKVISYTRPVYVAEDGKEFLNEADCRRHELGCLDEKDIYVFKDHVRTFVILAFIEDYDHYLMFLNYLEDKAYLVGSVKGKDEITSGWMMYLYDDEFGGYGHVHKLDDYTLKQFKDFGEFVLGIGYEDDDMDRMNEEQYGL